jgi:hypothetical protein
LSPYVEATLAALRADGIQPTDAEIGWLIKLRERCDRVAPDGELPPMWGAPAEIAGELYWPLHPLALDWWRRAFVLLPGEDKADCRRWAYLFAHTLSAPGDTRLRALVTRESIADSVTAWRVNTPLHEEHESKLVAFLRRVDGLDEDVPYPDGGKVKDDEPARTGDGIKMLCQAFPGTTPTYWQTEISCHDIDELLRANDRRSWADSATRSAHIENYMRAVKWVRRNHG